MSEYITLFNLTRAVVDSHKIDYHSKKTRVSSLVVLVESLKNSCSKPMICTFKLKNSRTTPA